MAQKYALFDSEGFIKAFYAEDVPVDVPVEAIPITDKQWQEILEYSQRWRLVDGKIVAYEPPPPPPQSAPESIEQRVDRLVGEAVKKALDLR